MIKVPLDSKIWAHAFDGSVISPNATALASDFVSTSAGAADVGKVPKLNASGLLDDTFGLNIAASTIVKGIVEEATAAEIVAQTATGGTGARLFINPSTMLKPAFQQDVALNNAGTVSVSSPEWHCGSSSDGSVLFIMIQNTGLFRFGKDATTGQYLNTHRLDPTLLPPSGDQGSIIVLGTFLYLFSNDGTNVVCSRFLAADLSGEQVMTVPTLASTSNCSAWTDGTFVWICSSSSNTVSHKWSLSGTTFTDTAVTGTVTAGAIAPSNLHGSMYDGTNAFIASTDTTGNFTIQKLTNIDGSARTTTTPSIGQLSGVQDGGIIVNIDALQCYIGNAYQVYDTVGLVSTRIMLYPITKP